MHRNATRTHNFILLPHRHWHYYLRTRRHHSVQHLLRRRKRIINIPNRRILVFTRRIERHTVLRERRKWDVML